MANYDSRATPWVSYVPGTTGFGTIGTTDMWWRRVGDSVEIRGRFNTGTTTGAEARVDLPNGMTVSSAKLATATPVGQWYSGSAIATPGGVLAGPGFSYLAFVSGASGASSFATLNGNQIHGTTAFAFHATVPVTGWS
jgi:hypothetical protein